jgi:cobalt-zinc-cadmium efflux system protein
MTHSHDHASHDAPFASLVRVFLLSGSFMFVEVAGGLWSGSLALLADSGHMAIDTAAVGLALFASWIARRPPTSRRTYGYYRAEILAASVNAVLLIVAALWICYEAWYRFGEPQTIKAGWMTGIAAAGLVVNLVGLNLLGGHSHGSLNLRAVSLHLIFDALGSVGAVLAGILVGVWGFTSADAVASLLIAALIFYGAFKLLFECVDILLEAVPRGVNTDEIKADLLAIDGVSSVHDLHVWALSTGVAALSAHLKIENTQHSARILKDCGVVLKKKHALEHVTLQLEPEPFSHDDTHLKCRET